MLIEKLGNKNFTLLAKMLDMEAASIRVNSQNIANVNTPHYRRRSFDFESSLRQAMSLGASEDYQAIQGHVAMPNTTAVRNNGNNVDIDLEMLNMKQSSALYDIYAQLYSRQTTNLRNAIRGTR